MGRNIYDVELKVALEPPRGLTVTLTTLDGSGPPLKADANLDGWRLARGMVEDWATGDLRDTEADRFSQILGQVLFPESIRVPLLNILRKNDRTRIWLRADQPQFRATPWEAAHAPIGPEGSSTVATAEGLSFFRRPASPAMAQLPPPLSGPLEVKFIVGPDTFKGYPLDPLESPADLLDELRALGPRLAIEEVSRTTWDDMVSRLGTANVLHFAGHAVSHHDEQALVFPGKEPDMPDFVTPRRLGNPFYNAKDLHVVVLAACSSAKISSGALHDGWSSLHCGAVVALQTAVIDERATAFTRGFYNELVDSGDLDEAVAEGRKSMRSRLSAFADAESVVVYSRYPKGPITLRPALTGSRGGGARGSAENRGTSKPLVRRYPVDAEDAELRTWLDRKFGRASGMDTGRLRSITPFVGPGTLQIEPAQERIRWDISLDRAMAESDAALGRFVNALFDARAKGRVRMPFEPDTDRDLSISQIRLDLARLAHIATAVFVQTALATSVPLNLWDDHGVALPADTDLFIQLRTTISHLNAHIGEFEPHPLLGEMLLRSRLETLLGNVQGPPGDKSRLTGSAVQWLTDLFWNAVIFDSPLYPHVAELSLQVSLLEGRGMHPIRHLDPTGAVIRQNLENISLVTAAAVARGFDASASSEGERRRFFRSIGEVLHAEYAYWRQPDPSLSRKTVPLALTSNFDLELERGLAVEGKPYHVAIPVYIGMWRDEPRRGSGGEWIEEDVRWLLGTFEGTGPNPEASELVRPTGPWRWLSSIEGIERGALELQGPLVLKLGGSPLHVIPRRSSDSVDEFVALGFDGLRRGRDRASSASSDSFGSGTPLVARVELEHAIALGEYDFLQVTRMSQWSFDRFAGSIGEQDTDRPKQGLPIWLISELRQLDRYWLLLGYRFADWNSRTQMHTFLSHAGVENDRGCAVSLAFDPDRIRFLDWLGVTQARGHAEQLTEPLRRIAARRRSQVNGSRD